MGTKFEERVEKVRASFYKNGLDALYITKEANVAYLTGTKGQECTILITKSDAYILTDFRYEEMALGLTWLKFIKTFSFGTEERNIVPLLEDSKYIGFEKDNISYDRYQGLLKNLPKKEIIATEGIVEELRMVKDEDELELIKHAADIASSVYPHMLDFVKPGVTEYEMAAEIVHYMMKQGASKTSFDTISVCGSKTSLPHGVPGNNVVKAGDFVTLDYGCVFEGYCSDMTRTFAVGYATEEMEEIYSIVLKAQLNACDKIHAGITGKEGDAFCRDIITQAGYGRCFGHGTGHGVGLEIHEAPYFRTVYADVIPENSVLSIEPGIYLNGKFGVRIEDLAIIKNDGIINLTNAPKQLIII